MPTEANAAPPPGKKRPLLARLEELEREDAAQPLGKIPADIEPEFSPAPHRLPSHPHRFPSHR